MHTLMSGYSPFGNTRPSKKQLQKLDSDLIKSIPKSIVHRSTGS